jgi:O-antigen/teichoic acid export membrane protein
LPGNSRLSARAAWGLASWALPLAIVFIVSPKLLHLLDASRFGVLMIALITPLIAAQLDLGIVSVGVRRLAATLANGKIDAGSTLLTLFIALATVGAVLGGLIWLNSASIATGIGFDNAMGDAEAADLVRACAVWIAVSLAMLLPGIAARALQAFLLLAILQTLGTLVLWTSALVLLTAGRTLADVVWVGVGLTIAIASITLYAIRRHIDWHSKMSFEAAILANDWRFSAGMFAAQTASAIVYQGDRILISILGSPAMAGLYALCSNVANKTSAAVAALTSFVFPHAAQLHSANRRENLGGLLHALDRAIAVLLIPVLLPGLFLAEAFLRLWIGAYATAEVVMAFRVLIIAFAIPAFAIPVSSILAGTGLSGLPARFAWLSVAVIVVSLVLLVPRYGLIGAALAMLLANSTSFIFSAVGRRTLQLGRPPGAARFWGGMLVGCLVQLVCLYVLAELITTWWALLAAGALAWSAFYAVRAIVGALSPEEIQLLQRARQRLAGHPTH